MTRVTKLTLSVLAGLAAVFGLVVGLSFVLGSLLPLIGVPMLAITAALALMKPGGCSPENSAESS